ncbi:helix-turn-helix transcriptional regulator [Lentilitoribacter sp. Alg239-R112]|uniref:helix-turn-helix domain-containing protein n=1 Tax=Lentilitoribacter sp. Alg239-R112 TaxID=2305987 RepID=UPI0013A6D5D8|nr:helix-turn-helix transcriptional regulator [Lentilitoribacter sp. Alg239-R112]
MSDQLKQNIGLRVKTIRNQRKLTQAQLAEAIDKTFEAISNLERGKTAPNFSTLADIARVLQVPMREFFEGIDAELSEDRQELFTKLNLLASQMDDETLELYLKLGDVLLEQRK